MKNLKQILRKLKENYGSPKTDLHYKTPFQLLVAVILSAQCTDKRVNLVTPKLFSELPDAQSFSQASIEQIEKLIYTTGFYKNKAKNIKETARIIVEEFDNEVPDNMNDLLLLPGVARKTANVVLGYVYGKSEGIAIDTHCIRLCNRFEWVKSKNAIIVERELMEELPKEEWLGFTNLMIAHGQAICTAINPNCEGCFLNEICPSKKI